MNIIKLLILIFTSSFIMTQSHARLSFEENVFLKETNDSGDSFIAVRTKTGQNYELRYGVGCTILKLYLPTEAKIRFLGIFPGDESLLVKEMARGETVSCKIYKIKSLD